MYNTFSFLSLSFLFTCSSDSCFAICLRTALSGQNSSLYKISVNKHKCYDISWSHFSLLRCKDVNKLISSESRNHASAIGLWITFHVQRNFFMEIYMTLKLNTHLVSYSRAISVLKDRRAQLLYIPLVLRFLAFLKSDSASSSLLRCKLATPLLKRAFGLLGWMPSTWHYAWTSWWWKTRNIGTLIHRHMH